MLNPRSQESSDLVRETTFLLNLAADGFCSSGGKSAEKQGQNSNREQLEKRIFQQVKVKIGVEENIWLSELMALEEKEPCFVETGKITRCWF